MMDTDLMTNQSGITRLKIIKSTGIKSITRFLIQVQSSSFVQGQIEAWGEVK